MILTESFAKNAYENYNHTGGESIKIFNKQISAMGKLKCNFKVGHFASQCYFGRYMSISQTKRQQQNKIRHRFAIIRAAKYDNKILRDETCKLSTQHCVQTVEMWKHLTFLFF